MKRKAATAKGAPMDPCDVIGRKLRCSEYQEKTEQVLVNRDFEIVHAVEIPRWLGLLFRPGPWWVYATEKGEAIRQRDGRCDFCPNKLDGKSPASSELGKVLAIEVKNPMEMSSPIERPGRLLVVHEQCLLRALALGKSQT